MWCVGEGCPAGEGKEGAVVEVSNSRESECVDEHIHCQLSHIADRDTRLGEGGKDGGRES